MQIDRPLVVFQVTADGHVFAEALHNKADCAACLGTVGLAADILTELSATV